MRCFELPPHVSGHHDETSAPIGELRELVAVGKLIHYYLYGLARSTGIRGEPRKRREACADLLAHGHGVLAIAYIYDRISSDSSLDSIKALSLVSRRLPLETTVLTD